MEEKKKRDKKPFIIIVLIIILGAIIYAYNVKNNLVGTSEQSLDSSSTSNSTSSSTTTTTESTVERKTIEKTISSSGEITTALDEKLSLHASYYFQEIYCSEGDYVKEGENILKYTNGTYLVAPYNLIIKSISVPSTNGQCKNSNYIEVYSLDSLQMDLSVSEDDLTEIQVGQEVKIQISSDTQKEYSGYITAISNSGTYSSSGTTYTATVTFENDGYIKIGMSGTADIVLSKAENVLVVPSEAVTTTNGTSYVTKVENGTTTKTQVEIGLSNDAYTQIKSGLAEGDVVQVEEKTSTNTQKMFMNNGGGMPSSRN